MAEVGTSTDLFEREIMNMALSTWMWYRMTIQTCALWDLPNIADEHWFLSDKSDTVNAMIDLPKNEWCKAVGIGHSWLSSQLNRLRHATE